MRHNGEVILNPSAIYADGATRADAAAARYQAAGGDDEFRAGVEKARVEAGALVTEATIANLAAKMSAREDEPVSLPAYLTDGRFTEPYIAYQRNFLRGHPQNTSKGWEPGQTIHPVTNTFPSERLPGNYWETRDALMAALNENLVKTGMPADQAGSLSEERTEKAMTALESESWGGHRWHRQRNGQYLDNYLTGQPFQLRQDVTLAQHLLSELRIRAVSGDEWVREQEKPRQGEIAGDRPAAFSDAPGKQALVPQHQGFSPRGLQTADLMPKVVAAYFLDRHDARSARVLENLARLHAGISAVQSDVGGLAAAAIGLSVRANAGLAERAAQIARGLDTGAEALLATIKAGGFASKYFSSSRQETATPIGEGENARTITTRSSSTVSDEKNFPPGIKVDLEGARVKVTGSGVDLRERPKVAVVPLVGENRGGRHAEPPTYSVRTDPSGTVDIYATGGGHAIFAGGGVEVHISPPTFEISGPALHISSSE